MTSLISANADAGISPGVFTSPLLDAEIFAKTLSANASKGIWSKFLISERPTKLEVRCWKLEDKSDVEVPSNFEPSPDAPLKITWIQRPAQ